MRPEAPTPSGFALALVGVLHILKNTKSEKGQKGETMRKLLCAVLVVVVLFAASISAEAVEYRMVRLGLVAGASVGVANAINDAGTIVGMTEVSGARAAVWRNGLCELIGGISGEASGINASGAIIGINRVGPGYGFLYSGYIMRDLGSMSAPFGINDAGWVTGRKSRDGAGSAACAWTPDGTFIDMNGNGAEVFDVNNSLQFVGHSNPWSPATLWTIDPLTLSVRLEYYQNLPGCISGIAYAINDSGVAAGRSGTRPVIWDSLDAAPIDLLFGYPSTFSGSAWGINASGQVVGHVVSNLGTAQKTSAFVWDRVHGLSLLPDIGGEGRAYGINNYGQIVGQASGDSLFPVLWEPVPEPSSLIALTGGIGSLFALLRRRA